MPATTCVLYSTAWKLEKVWFAWLSSWLFTWGQEEAKGADGSTHECKAPAAVACRLRVAGLPLLSGLDSLGDLRGELVVPRRGFEGAALRKCT